MKTHDEDTVYNSICNRNVKKKMTEQIGIWAPAHCALPTELYLV